MKFLVCLLFLLFTTSVRADSLIWSGDYDGWAMHHGGPNIEGAGGGHFRQWHMIGGSPQFHGVPPYGRPVRKEPEDPYHSEYYGDGEDLLLTLVTDNPELEEEGYILPGPVRQGNYAARFTVKSFAGGGSEEELPWRDGTYNKDCDPAGNMCSKRRTELWMMSNMSTVYDGMPYMSERWISVSHFIPSDWDDGGSGWAVVVFQIKAKWQEASPCFSITINQGKWVIRHRWSDVEATQENRLPQPPWQRQMYYTSDYPTTDDWSDGLAHFPEEGSQAALGDLNKGGWTDWIAHMKFDARGSGDGGAGFIKLWQRKGDGDWVHVLHITPGVTTRGGDFFDHGVMFNAPAVGDDNGGFGLAAGLYMDKDQVWALPENRVIYNDNIRVHDETATFEEMLPEGLVEIDCSTAPEYCATEADCNRYWGDSGYIWDPGASDGTGACVVAPDPDPEDTCATHPDLCMTREACESEGNNGAGWYWWSDGVCRFFPESENKDSTAAEGCAGCRTTFLGSGHRYWAVLLIMIFLTFFRRRR